MDTQLGTTSYNPNNSSQNSQQSQMAIRLTKEQMLKSLFDIKELPTQEYPFHKPLKEYSIERLESLMSLICESFKSKCTWVKEEEEDIAERIANYLDSESYLDLDSCSAQYVLTALYSLNQRIKQPEHAKNYELGKALETELARQANERALKEAITELQQNEADKASKEADLLALEDHTLELKKAKNDSKKTTHETLIQELYDRVNKNLFIKPGLEDDVFQYIESLDIQKLSSRCKSFLSAFLKLQWGNTRLNCSESKLRCLVLIHNLGGKLNKSQVKRIVKHFRRLSSPNIKYSNQIRSILEALLNQLHLLPQEATIKIFNHLFESGQAEAFYLNIYLDPKSSLESKQGLTPYIYQNTEKLIFEFSKTTHSTFSDKDDLKLLTTGENITSFQNQLVSKIPSCPKDLQTLIVTTLISANANSIVELSKFIEDNPKKKEIINSILTQIIELSRKKELSALERNALNNWVMQAILQGNGKYIHPSLSKIRDISFGIIESNITSDAPKMVKQKAAECFLDHFSAIPNIHTLYADRGIALARIILDFDFVDPCYHMVCLNLIAYPIAQKSNLAKNALTRILINPSISGSEDTKPKKSFDLKQLTAIHEYLISSGYIHLYWDELNIKTVFNNKELDCLTNLLKKTLALDFTKEFGGSKSHKNFLFEKQAVTRSKNLLQTLSILLRNNLKQNEFIPSWTYNIVQQVIVESPAMFHYAAQTGEELFSKITVNSTSKKDSSVKDLKELIDARADAAKKIVSACNSFQDPVNRQLEIASKLLAQKQLPNTLLLTNTKLIAAYSSTTNTDHIEQFIKLSIQNDQLKANITEICQFLDDRTGNPITAFILGLVISLGKEFIKNTSMSHKAISWMYSSFTDKFQLAKVAGAIIHLVTPKDAFTSNTLDTESIVIPPNSIHEQLENTSSPTIRTILSTIRAECDRERYLRLPEALLLHMEQTQRHTESYKYLTTLGDYMLTSDNDEKKAGADAVMALVKSCGHVLLTGDDNPLTKARLLNIITLATIIQTDPNQIEIIHSALTKTE